MAVAEIKSYWARAKAEAAGWWANKWGRRAIVAVGVLALGWIAILLLFARDLPSTEALLAYEPPLPSHVRAIDGRSEEHTSELQSLMRISYAVFCLKKKKKKPERHTTQKDY